MNTTSSDTRSTACVVGGLALVLLLGGCQERIAVHTESAAERARPVPLDTQHVRPQDIAVRALPDLAVSEDDGFSVEDCELVLTIQNPSRGGVPTDEFERAVMFIYVTFRSLPGEYTRYTFSLEQADPERRLTSGHSEVAFYTGIAVFGSFVADLNLDPHDDVLEVDPDNGDVTTLMDAPPSCTRPVD
jgi:hypothetical protein